MNGELQFAYRVRRALNQGADDIDAKVAARLHEAREKALVHHRSVTVGAIGLAGLGQFATGSLATHGRVLVAAIALMVGAAGSYYWNNTQQAAERAEIDSALLADEVHFAAYLDQGFMEWLDHISQEEDSAPQEYSLPE